jgi:hypothetical protein
MTTARLRYSRDEILTDPDYATRIERNGVLFHGGYAADGTYLPPRSVHRVPAIAAWAAQLEAAVAIPAASSNPRPWTGRSSPTPNKPRCSFATARRGP